MTEVEHEITVAAPAAAVYQLLADVRNWPRIFPPTVHVEQIEQGAGQQRIQIWATADGGVRNWTSLRELDPVARRIDFRQEISPAPVASMSGTWIIEPLPGDHCRIRLLHRYRAIDDDPAGLARIGTAVDTNSRAELAGLKSTVEHVTAAADLTFSFTDSVPVNGPAKDVYDFIDQADRWAERLPHVASVRLDEPAPGLQVLEMDTRAADGSTHTTKSYRVCLPAHKIAYKQVTLPPLMSLHTGYWTFQDGPDGVLASSQHTVVLNRDNITRLLGADATVDKAKALVREALGTNSRTTLAHAKAFVETNR
jgi:aromatase